MCYNKDISLEVYLTTCALSLLLYLTGDKYDKHIGLFSIVFIHMQLIEYFMWSDQKCGKMNHYATELGYYLLLLQPFFALCLGIIFQTFTISNKYVLICVLITMIPFFEKLLTKPRKRCSKGKVNDHLNWDMNGSILTIFIYMGFLFIPWLFLKNKQKGIAMFLLTLLTLILSHFNTLKKTDFKSFWCFIGTFAPLFIIILNKLNSLKL